jgi:hypothetical protein
VFVTAGACGPCRFGMYVTEYRKALRDAGFDGFRVLLFQQTGGLKQATGEEVGSQDRPALLLVALCKALIAGDVINLWATASAPTRSRRAPPTRPCERPRTWSRGPRAHTSVLVALPRRRREGLRESVKVDRTAGSSPRSPSSASSGP